MAFDAHKNFAVSTVATAPSPATSGTSLIVAAGEGSRFPTAPFNATIWPVNTLPTPANSEIVRVTAISTDTFTITRTQESTSARTVVVGDQIAATITAKTLTDIEGAITPSIDIQTFTGNGTWTKPTGAIKTEVFAWMGGNGGGSGRKGASATQRCGGGGGAGGTFVYALFDAAILGATETVTIGGGGTGGASVTANSTNGNDGGKGGTTTFGSWVKADAPGVNSNGKAGTTSSFGNGGSASNSYVLLTRQAGNGGQNTGVGTTVFTSALPGGGGCGGTISAADSAATGGTTSFVHAGVSYSSGANGNPASNGSDTTAQLIMGGTGGGGGDSSTSGNGGTGGKGGFPGGGGGGGGASTDSVGDSGAGGDGADGYCIVISHLQ